MIDFTTEEIGAEVENFKSHMSTKIGKVFILKRSYRFYGFPANPRATFVANGVRKHSGTAFILCEVNQEGQEIIFKVLIGNLLYDMHINYPAMIQKSYTVPYDEAVYGR